MTIELTFENVYLDAQSFERVTRGGKLQVDILKSQLSKVSSLLNCLWKTTIELSLENVYLDVQSCEHVIL